MKDKSFHTEKAKNGSNTLFYLENGVKKYLHSRYEPEKEAETIIKNVDASRYDFIVLFGNALGYVLKKLLAQKEIKKIIVVEKKKELYEEFLTGNGKTMFSEAECRVEFIINTPGEAAIERISRQFSLMDHKGFFLVELASVVILDKEYYNELKRGLNISLDKRISDQLTESALGISLWNNLLNNLSESVKLSILKIDHDSSLKNDVIIVSAGTSLVDDIPVLRKLQHTALIFSADTALKYLLKNNIKPDLVFSLDPQYYSYLHYYQEEKTAGQVMDIFAGFSLTKFLKNPSFLISKNFISDRLFNKEDLLDSSGGSVTNFIYQFIKGHFHRIIFSGLDLCYEDSKMYIPHTYITDFFIKRNTRMSTLQDKYFSFYKSRAKRKIAFRGKEYYTTYSMINYFNWLKQEFSGKENIFLSSSCLADFKNVQRIDLSDIKSHGKEDKVLYLKDIPKKELLKKISSLKDDPSFMDLINNMVISSRFINSWKEMDNHQKQKIYQNNRIYLSEKIEKLK
ncbi:MAG: DUF115 domain-containing protein [Spirochaetes bacterium]|nr:DUF115 domain-containing protein [Spirochaetota bacterium]